MNILGIDPGIGGALAIIKVADRAPVAVEGLMAIDMPVVEVDGAKSYVCGAGLRTFLMNERLPPFHAFIERVNAMPVLHDRKTGERRPMAASSAFQFGDSFGSVRTAVAVVGIPFTIISSPAWKKYHGLKGSDKEASRRRAIELSGSQEFFSRKKDQGRAEAYLIALYGAARLLASPEDRHGSAQRRGKGADEFDDQSDLPFDNEPGQAA